MGIFADSQCACVVGAEPSMFDGYNIALTPTTKLPSKTVDVRV
jgi:hypothetical protein